MAKYPNVLRRTLDIIFYALIVLMVLALALIAYFSAFRPDDISLAVPITFTPDPGTVTLSSDVYGEGTIVYAQGMAEFENTGGSEHTLKALVLVASFLIPAFVILHLLRRLVRTVADGQPFQVANVNRIRAIGLMVVVFEVFYGIVAYLLDRSVAAGVVAQGITPTTNFSIDVAVVLIGLVIIALAEVFRYGAGLQVESDLTV